MEAKRIPKTSKISIILALVCTIFTASGQLFLKLGSAKISSVMTFFNLFIIIGLLLFFFGSFLFIYALQKGELSIISPIMTLSYVWVAILSIVVLNETINIVRWTGIGSIVAGLSLIGLGGKYGH